MYWRVVATSINFILSFLTNGYIIFYCFKLGFDICYTTTIPAWQIDRHALIIHEKNWRDTPKCSRSDFLIQISWLKKSSVPRILTSLSVFRNHSRTFIVFYILHKPCKKGFICRFQGDFRTCCTKVGKVIEETNYVCKFRRVAYNYQHALQA